MPIRFYCARILIFLSLNRAKNIFISEPPVHLRTAKTHTCTNIADFFSHHISYLLKCIFFLLASVKKSVHFLLADVSFNFYFFHMNAHQDIYTNNTSTCICLFSKLLLRITWMEKWDGTIEPFNKKKKSRARMMQKSLEINSRKNHFGFSEDIEKLHREMRKFRLSRPFVKMGSYFCLRRRKRLTGITIKSNERKQCRGKVSTLEIISWPCGRLILTVSSVNPECPEQRSHSECKQWKSI